MFTSLEQAVESKYPINDLYIQSISKKQAHQIETLRAYAFEDHLLKRIGSIEFIELDSDERIPAFLRPQADELWVLLNGEAEFEWCDRRQDSPTLDAVHSFTAASPVRVLVPFGVQFSLTAKSASRFLRICSHAGAIEDYLSEKAES